MINKKKDYLVLSSTIDMYFGLSSQLNTSQKIFYFLPEIVISRDFILKINDFQFGAYLLFGTEFLLDPEIIYGFKISASVYAFQYSLALCLVYYTNFEKGNFKLRPEFGWNYGDFKLLIGFNISTYENYVLKTMKDSDIQLSIYYFLSIYEIFKVEVRH